MEKDTNQKVADQKEVIRDLQDRITKSTDEDERKSLQLKLDVAEAKLKEIENEQRTEVETSATSEGVSQNTKIFHNALTDEEQLDEAKMTWKEQRANDLRQRIKRAMANRDKTKGDARAKWQEGINDMRRQLKKVLSEDIVKESLPQGYSESKFLKELEQSCKYFEDEVKNIRKAAKDKRYDLIAAYFARTANFAKMLSDNTEDIVSQQKKGVLTESMPNGYSKSKFLKEMKDAVKDVKELADKANRFIDKGNLDDIRLIFKSIKGYCEMVEGNCQDIVNQEKKGVLTESQDEDYIIKQVCLYAKPQMFKSKGVTPAMLATAIGDYIATAPNSSDIFNVNHFAKILDRIIANHKENPNKYILQKVEKNCSKLFEGCMTKKFENMTNREVASYIFSHPHTKFASKMKECDDKEIMKAIRDMKKEMAEEAPVTNTSAVATAPKPSMYLKRPEQEELRDNQ